MVQEQTRRPTLEKTPCTKYPATRKTDPTTMVSMLHDYCWSRAWMSTHNPSINGHRYTLHPTMGSPTSYSCFLTMVPMRTRSLKMETTLCTRYAVTRKANPKRMVSALHGYC